MLRDGMLRFAVAALLREDTPVLKRSAQGGASIRLLPVSGRFRRTSQLPLHFVGLAVMAFGAPADPQVGGPGEAAITIRISSPASGSTHSNLYSEGSTSVPVVGTITGQTLKEWRLDVAPATSPTSWTPLATGTSPVTEGRLTTWSTAGIPNGRYLLRLQGATSSGTRSTTETEVTLANISVSSSSRQVDVGAGGSVTLTTVLPIAARQRLEIMDMRGAVVRSLVNASREPGQFVDVWDGHGDRGERLKDSQYRWVALFEDGTSKLTVDLTSEVDGDAEVKSHPEYKDWRPYDNEPLRIRLHFDRPGEIVLVFSHFTYYVTPSCTPPEFFCRFLDGWDPAGDFDYEWAGVDDSGTYRDDIHGILVISHHEDLSRNGIVTFGGRPKVTGVKVTPAFYFPDRGPQELAFSLTTYRTEPASAVITWTSQENRSVLRRMVLPSVVPGLVKTSWNGRADNSMRVAPGNYTVAIVVTDSLGQTARGEILTRVEY
jgi:flagellar hook assembly protein FlgD